MRAILFIPVLLLIAFALTGQEVKHQIYLIGDAGKDTAAGPALMMLQSELEQHPNSTVLFLGDNIYPAGLQGKDGTKKQRISEKRLLSELDRTEHYHGNVFWVPGNHDWKAGRWDGHILVNDEAEFVETYYQNHPDIKNAQGPIFMPKGGLPGPSFVPMKEAGFNLICFDLQWWLQDQFFHKVTTEKGMNKKQMETRFLLQLDSLIALSVKDSQIVVIAAHHPMYSNGHHGAPEQPFRFLFNWIPPFPIFGLMGLNRALVQDIPQPRYNRIRKHILQVLDKYQGLIYVSGHDHNLQYLRKQDNFYLVSGAGSKLSSFRGDRYKARFMDDVNIGFMRLDLMATGAVRCNVFGHTAKGILTSFWLK